MNSTMPRPEFPADGLLARCFFEEGIRHLEDAQILHGAQRFPGAIASAMKAAEFGIKTVVVLDGAMGWWEKIFLTHSPLSDIDRPDKPFFQHHIETLNDYEGPSTTKKTLVTLVKAMENLVPARPGGSYDIEAQQNPEYPFLSFDVASSTFVLVKPSTHFREDDSRKYCNTAQDLLTAITTQYVTVGGWALTLPFPL